MSERTQTSTQQSEPKIIRSAAPGSVEDLEHRLRMLKMAQVFTMTREQAVAHVDRVAQAQAALTIARAAQP